MKKNFGIILTIGLVLRVILAVISFHPDIRAFQLAGHLIATGNVLNLYDYLAGCAPNTELLHVFSTDLFIYPPLIYLLHGVFNFIFTFIFGAVENNYLIDNAQLFSHLPKDYSLHLLLLKVPYLFFDIPTAFLLASLFDKTRQKLLAFTFWIFNPINLYVTYMQGQFDVISVFFTVLSLVFIKRKQLLLASLALGFGVAFKLYPLYLIIPFLLISKRWGERVSMLVLSLLPYLLSIAPFITSPGFRSTALVAGQTTKSFFAQIPLSGGESIYLFPVVLVFWYITYWYSPTTVKSLVSRWLIILLTFFVFTHYHPQWFLWTTPLLIIELIRSELKLWPLVVIMLVTFFGSLFLFDPSLTTGILAPLIPGWYNAPSIWQIMHLKIDDVYIRSLLQSLFVAAAIGYVYIHAKVSPDDSN